MQTKQRLRAMGMVLLASMAVTEGLLLLEGRWREAIPLHLCSISAIVSAVLAFCRWPGAMDFLWYLGMPGAALALVFPAPAVSCCQVLLNASYVTTHLMILLIPACRLAAGMRPRIRRTAEMLCVLLGIAIAAYGVNRRLGTDFLFLMAPPSGTPLVGLFSYGLTLYRLTLFVLMGLLCVLMDRLARKIDKKQHNDR